MSQRVSVNGFRGRRIAFGQALPRDRSLMELLAAGGETEMISVTQCADFAGLASNETMLGVVPSARHRLLLSGYLLNSRRGQAAVRDMIVADLRAALDLGARLRAADLLIVLRFFLTDHPEARRNARHAERMVEVDIDDATAICAPGVGGRSPVRRVRETVFGENAISP